MNPIQRLIYHFSTSSPPPRILLDPDEAAHEQAHKAYQYHVFQVPRLRLLGLSLVALFVLLHNLFLQPTASAWADFWRVLLLFTGYAGVSWLILLRWYHAVNVVHLGFCFLVCDIALFVVAIYYSGGEHSWLFFLLMVRAGDQTRTSYRKALFFTHAATLAYALLLAYLKYVEQRSLSLPAALTTVGFIYATNLYFALVAKTAEHLQNLLTTAIRIARGLFKQYDAQTTALRASASDYRALIACSIQGIYIQQQHRIQLANAALARLFGYDCPEALIGQDYAMLVATHERDRLEDYRCLCLQGQPAPERYEYQGLRQDGAVLWIECLMTRITWHGAPAILVTLQDITARKQAEEALWESERRFRRLIEDSLQGIVIHRDFVPVFANRAYAQILGYETTEAILALPSLLQILTPQERAWVQLSAQARQQQRDVPSQQEHQVLRRDGTLIWLDVYAQRVLWEGAPAILVSIFDITARKQAEEERQRLTTQLQQAQKMEALGTMAGGIAHDFNNILTAILGYTELTADEMPRHSRAWNQLQQVLSAGHRAKELVQQILAFSRHGNHKRVPLQLDLNVQEVLGLLRASLPTTIDLHTHLALEIGYVLADPTQIHQVLLNLGTNAIHAMQESGGVLEIGLDTIEIEPGRTPQQPDVPPGSYARLTVCDTGHGIPPDVLDRIFEPFFTTKEVGVGTGLGLSVVHGIITAHHGAISVHSTVGQGTTFTIYLPRLQPSAVEGPQDETLCTTTDTAYGN